MKRLIFGTLTLLNLTTYGQETAHQFDFEPQRPTRTSSITFQYNSRPVFQDNDNITCIVYFTGLNDKTKQRDDFPIARVIDLKRSGEIWIGRIDTIPQRATALVFAFIDSLDHRDTNNGKGYYIPIYENDKILSGAWAGIGDLLYGNWITKESEYHIKDDLDSARKYFIKDFTLYQEIKRQCFRQYLHTFKLSNPDDEKRYKTELEEMAHLPDVTQNELFTIHFEYGRLKDTVNANKYERLIFDKFPNGSWTVQAKTLKQLMAVGMTHDFDKQIKIYQQFKENYLKSYEDEYATIRMNDRAGQMLGYMLEHFIKEGTMDLWMKEVNELTDNGKISAYLYASRELLELGRPNPTKQPKKNNSEIEHPFFQNTIEEPDRNVKIAGDLAMRAIEISKNNFDNTRKYNEPLILTDVEVKDFRNTQMSWYLEILGISLMKQNKFSEAAEIMTEAVNANHYKESSVNQTYIESLVKVGKIDKALSEIEKIVAKGKSTTVIDKFYAKYKKKESNISEFKDQSVEKAKELVKQKLLNENAPDFSYYDLNGKEIRLSSLKNKIVVIDVWASWCGPCMITLEAIDQVIDKYKTDTDIVFLLIGEDESKTRAMKVIDERRNKSAFVFDREREFVKKYAASLPTQIIIDKKGKLKFRTNGLTTFNVQENAVELEAMIKTLKERE
jgi:thiol-disulfide isomerase/thioredoxin